MLEAKTLTIKKSTNSSGKVVNFVPEIIENEEAYIYKNDGKRSNLINVNSNEEKILPKDTKLEIL